MEKGEIYCEKPMALNHEDSLKWQIWQKIKD